MLAVGIRCEIPKDHVELQHYALIVANIVPQKPFDATAAGHAFSFKSKKIIIGVNSGIGRKNGSRRD